MAEQTNLCSLLPLSVEALGENILWSWSLLLFWFCLFVCLNMFFTREVFFLLNTHSNRRHQKLFSKFLSIRKVIMRPGDMAQWLSGWFLFQMTWIQLLAPIWQLTPICNSSSRGSHTLCKQVAHIHTNTHETKNSERQPAELCRARGSGEYLLFVEFELHKSMNQARGKRIRFKVILNVLISKLKASLLRGRQSLKIQR